jgi:hypothetical protein
VLHRGLEDILKTKTEVLYWGLWLFKWYVIPVSVNSDSGKLLRGLLSGFGHASALGLKKEAASC